ncbi:MAG: glycosyltransferase family 1 protein [Acidobacteriota bacterium]|nr:glycosyltransferase family 1 protein [Acidobacteriota bacterium]
MPPSLKDRIKRAFGPVWPLIASPVVWYRVQRHRLDAYRSRPRPRRRRPRVARARATLAWLRDCFSRFQPPTEHDTLLVAVDGTAFWERLTGVGWYLHQLMRQLADSTTVRLEIFGPSVFAQHEDPAAAVPFPEGPAIVPMKIDVPDGLLIPRPWLVRLLRRLESRLIRRRGYDVVFAPNFLLPRKFDRTTAAVAVTVHDLAMRHFPWTLQEETLRALEADLGRTLGRASAVLTPSEAVRSEIEATGSVTAEVTAIHHGPGHLVRLGEGRVPEAVPPRFALFVGTLEPRKNLVTLVEAWQGLAAEGAAIPLVMVGRWGWKDAQLRERVEQASREGWLIHLGYVPDEELAGLYRAATMMVCPSLYEGFGLPIIEALAGGCPVVCSDLAVFKEVAGTAAVYVPSSEPDEWRRVVADLVADDRRRADLAQLGIQRAAEFSWERAAAEAEAAWRRACGRSS